MSKAESQLVFIARLRDYCSERIPSHYESEGPMAFMRTTLQHMSESIMKLKSETLSGACGSFVNSLEAGGVTDESLVEFKGLLDKLVSPSKFIDIKIALMMGDKDGIKKELLNVSSLSFLEEERKNPGEKDRAVDERVSFIYRRLQFDEYEKEFLRDPKQGVDNVLLKARMSVKDYCCMMRIPLNDNDTLSPFILSDAEAMIAANERFLKRIRQIELDSRSL